MRFRLVVAAAISLVFPSALIVAGSACKDHVIIPPGEGGAGVGGAGSSETTYVGTGTGKDGGKDAFDDYVDPGCMNQPPPIEDFECDPYHQNNGDCESGNACYIYVEYPSAPCGQETYGAICEPAGIGGQGDPCQGATDCVPGAACVVTGSGTQCVVLCPLMGPSGCPSGTVCEPIDVSGYGGCL